MNDIFSLKNKKSIAQAIIFYLVLTIGLFFLFIVVDQVFSQVPAGVRFFFGIISAAIIPFALSLAIITQKNLKEPIYILVIFLTLLGWFAGLFIGFLPVAFLTTVPPKKKKK